MAKMRKIRCWGCHSLDVIKWDKQGGKQRYKSTKTLSIKRLIIRHLKQNISIDRGLSKEHYRSNIKWYLFFKSSEKRFSLP